LFDSELNPREKKRERERAKRVKNRFQFYKDV
jgi:hypothetical protein